MPFPSKHMIVEKRILSRLSELKEGESNRKLKKPAP
jgi:hypothetical protein